ncbi:terpene synthase family protein [Micromonospora siamensis]|uniref:Terpene synthase family, metal binding domain n=1 Tax=Micromonospora siamensis TaxID=299152 RepID=A0A1C5JC75_9ACTN|nr:terpene synthase family protein [Micromonospora siamensis]SCG68170.1 Terpene synthase family, metal binding domain [Micromonospora siamensis]
MTPLSGWSPAHGGDQLVLAAEQGRICALATKGQRDLQDRVAAYPDLFPSRPFDPALLGNVAMTIAFGAPWCDVSRLRVVNRTVLWIFAVDWLVDYVATSRDEIDRLTADCLAVADGRAPAADDPLGRFLAELRDEQATAAAFATHRAVWRGELARMLDAMAREWEWKKATGPGRLPSLAEYLDNAANLASTLTNVVHWIHSDDPATLAHLDELVVASDEVQRILRLINDLATYERDLRWGDLNSLLLVSDRTEVEQLIPELITRARELIAPLRVSCPVQADYLDRQIGFSSGFYGSTDFWGAL